MKPLLAMLAVAAGCAAATIPAYADDTPPLFCRGGPSMTIENINNGWVIHYQKATQPVNDNAPGPGQCAFPDDVVPGTLASTLAIAKTQKNAIKLLAAAKGGTFQVNVQAVGLSLLVKEVIFVVVEDAGPPDDEVAEADDGAQPDEADGNDGGADDDGVEVALGGKCGDGDTTATVVIPEPHLKTLNIRTEPGGTIIGKVKEGRQVTLIGPCGDKAAAGFAKKKTSKSKEVWCAISKPLAGCVNARYLELDEGGAAGLVADD